MFQSSFLFLLIMMTTFFICSFSSIFSAMLLIFSSFIMMSMVYWNLVAVVPLYLFSLFLLGGLYVLIGFVMMADIRDLDMVLSNEKVKEFLVGMVGIYLGFNFVYPLEGGLSLHLMEFSPMKTISWTTSIFLSTVFLFLIGYLLSYLFILHMVMKSSSSGGGFVEN